jgi:hypothetical protein
VEQALAGHIQRRTVVACHATAIGRTPNMAKAWQGRGFSVLMIENHHSGLLWRLMRGCHYVVAGLRRAGFSGGWLK